MSKSKNDTAWEKIFKKYDIINAVKSEGYFEINASQINEFREARLMTKFDFSSQLPKIFSIHKFSILPISRGSYIISTFETFHTFETNDVETIKINPPYYLESIDIKNITSESAALNCAYICGMIESFVNDTNLKPTVNGRMSSLKFSFDIKTAEKYINVIVNNSQIEIDGGYEGDRCLYLIEAKNSISQDFLVRQIYYPFKLWENRISKPVITIFLTYSNGIFHFREYGFEDSNYYNSLKLIKERKYTFKDDLINFELIKGIVDSIEIVVEPELPFPQANSFERVINLCELLFENKFISRNQITENYDFNVRQTNYYTNACRYLGLVEKKWEHNEVFYFLTVEGEKLFELSMTNRKIKYIELILSHFTFNKALIQYFYCGEPPNKKMVLDIMRSSKIYKLNSERTLERRSSTVLSWINWILDQNEEGL